MSETRTARASEQHVDDAGVRTCQPLRSNRRRLLTPPPSGRADTVRGTADGSSEPNSSAGPAFQARRPHIQPRGSWPRRSHLVLGALPGAVPYARLHSKQVLWEWGLAQLSESSELVVSEIVTNAIQAVAAQAIPAPIRLWLLSDHSRVRIAVWDADTRPPQLQSTPVDGRADWNDERGRGLLLVASFSERWGWYPTPGWGGKVVWAEVTGRPDPRESTRTTTGRQNAAPDWIGEPNDPWLSTQIARGLIRDITAGKITPMDPLPSRAELAERYGSSIRPPQRAARAGITYRVPGLGYYLDTRRKSPRPREDFLPTSMPRDCLTDTQEFTRSFFSSDR